MTHLSCALSLAIVLAAAAPLAVAQAPLEPITSPAPGPSATNGFGRAIEVDGDRMVVIADDWPGATTVFDQVAVFLERDGAGDWSFDGFVENEPGAPFGFPGDFALDGDVFVALLEGELWIYERQGPGAWARVAALGNPLPSEYLYASHTVCVDGDDVFILGLTVDTFSLAKSSIFRFTRDAGGTWAFAELLEPSFAVAPPMEFARIEDLAVDDGRLVVQVGYFRPSSAPSVGPWKRAMLRFFEYQRDGVGAWPELGVAFTIGEAPFENLLHAQYLEFDGDLSGVDYQPSGSEGRLWQFWQRQPNGAWSETPAFEGPAFEGPPGESWSVDFSEGRLLIADTKASENPTEFKFAGLAQVFEYQPGGTWVARPSFGAPETTAFDYVGEGVAIDGGVAYLTDSFPLADGFGGVTYGLGAVHRFDLSDLGDELQTAQTEVSLATGGVVWISVAVEDDTPTGLLDHAQSAWVLGSASGVAPGLPLGPLGDLPLVWDAYTTATLVEPNQGPFQGTLMNSLIGVPVGPGEGQGTAAIVIPPGLGPALVGTTLYHSAVGFTILPGGLTLDGVGNAVATVLVP